MKRDQSQHEIGKRLMLRPIRWPKRRQSFVASQVRPSVVEVSKATTINAPNGLWPRYRASRLKIMSSA